MNTRLFDDDPLPEECEHQACDRRPTRYVFELLSEFPIESVLFMCGPHAAAKLLQVKR